MSCCESLSDPGTLLSEEVAKLGFHLRVHEVSAGHTPLSSNEPFHMCMADGLVLNVVLSLVWAPNMSTPPPFFLLTVGSSMCLI